MYALTTCMQIRFDVAYHGNFKCNIRNIRNGYPSIHLWLRKLYWNVPAFRDTCYFDHIKAGYYWAKAVSFCVLSRFASPY